MSLPFELYFASGFQSWNGGGGAFIRGGPGNRETLGRMYLIRYAQFNDVVLQENGQKPDGTTIVPSFAQLSKIGMKFPLNVKSAYNLLMTVSLSRHEGAEYPVVTFTTNKSFVVNKPPSEDYVKTIAGGLIECYRSMTPEEIADYLKKADGITGSGIAGDISRWVSEAR